MKIVKIIGAIFGIKEKLYIEIDKLDKYDNEVDEYVDEIIDILDKAEDNVEAAKGIVDLIQAKLKRLVDKIFN